MDPKAFMDRAIRKRRGLLEDRTLPEGSVSSFLAGICCAMDAIEAGGGDCCGWIPVGNSLPREQAGPRHADGLSYEVTLQKGPILDIAYCRFQDGHWWNGDTPADSYVTAWRKRPAPYRGKEKEKNNEENSIS